MSPLVITHQRVVTRVFLLCYSFPDFHSDLSAPSKNELGTTRLFMRCPPQLPSLSAERRSRWDHLERQPRKVLRSDPRPGTRQMGAGVPSLWALLLHGAVSFGPNGSKVAFAFCTCCFLPYDELCRQFLSSRRQGCKWRYN